MSPGRSLPAWRPFGTMQGVVTTADPTAPRPSAAAVWPWEFIVGGVLSLIGGMLHPGEDSRLSEEEATAEFIGAAPGSRPTP